MRISVFVPALLAVAGGAFLLRPVEAALGTPAPATAPIASGSYTFDVGHSSILFRIKHFNTAWNFGRFENYSGEFVLDEDPAKCSVKVEIDAASVDSFNEQRDQHITGPDFFSVKEFPKVTFESTRVALDGEDYTVMGDMTFHGVTKPVTIQLAKTGEGETRQGYKVGFLGECTIQRRDFGIDTYPDEVLSDEVVLTLAIEAVRGE